MGKYVYNFLNAWPPQANKFSLYSRVSTEITLHKSEEKENTSRMYFHFSKCHKIPLQILLKIRYLSRCTYSKALEQGGDSWYPRSLLKKSFSFSLLTQSGKPELTCLPDSTWLRIKVFKKMLLYMLKKEASLVPTPPMLCQHCSFIF